MKHLLLITLLLSSSASAACPDFSGLYVTSKESTSQGADGKPASTRTVYEYMLLEQTGCEKLVWKALKDSGVSTEIEAEIGASDWKTYDTFKYKAYWNNTKLMIEGKPEETIKKLLISFSKYDDGAIQIMEYMISVSVGDGQPVTSSGRETKVWERLR